MADRDSIQPLLEPLHAREQNTDLGNHSSNHADGDGADGSSQGGDVEAPKLSPRAIVGSTHWLMTTAILLGDMFGLGTLSLPSDFARLGWVPALTAMVLFAVGDVYSGSLYQRLSLAHPDAAVFDQLGERALGRPGRALVYATCYLTVFFEPTIFHLMCVESLRQVFWAQQLSGPLASVIVTAMVLPMAQIQQMHDIAWLAILGTVGMTLAVFVVVGKLVAMYLADPTASAATPTQLVATGGISSALVGLMDIAFAYGGQVNWMRYITTMRDKRRFTAAVGITSGSMSIMFLAVGVIGYGLLGTSVDLHRPISSVLAQDGWLVIMNAGIFVHCLLAYVLNVNVWSASLLHIAAPKCQHAIEHAPTWGGRALWAATTTASVAIAAALAWLFPFFSVVMAVIASLGDLASMFALPCMFALQLLVLSRSERALCYVLAVVALSLSAVGVFSSVHQLIAAWSGQGDQDAPALAGPLRWAAAMS